jgi:hypothetical protein
MLVYVVIAGYVVSDQGAIGTLSCALYIKSCSVECRAGVARSQLYIGTASACVNAGVSLEDGNLYNIFNVFDHIGEAVAAVSNTVVVM